MVQAQPVSLIGADEWARPRDGMMVTGLPGARAAVQALDASPSARLHVQYPTGEAGQLWAEELHAWMVALGVPSRRMHLESGSVVTDALRLEVRTP